jgi:hypothetical protein
MKRMAWHVSEQGLAIISTQYQKIIIVLQVLFASIVAGIV